MGTVAKALELLDLFRRDRPQIGLSDLARLSGVNKATCFRLMSELQVYGLIEQIGAGREYRVGPAVLRLAALREEVAPFKEVVAPILADLAESTGESAHASVLAGDRVELVHFAYSTQHGTRVMMHDADHLPFHASSSGMAILAYAPPALRERVLASGLTAFTSETVTDPNEIRARLGEIERTGYAESAGAFETDVHSIAVPLFNAQSACMGGLAVAAPSARMDDALRSKIKTNIAAAALRVMQLQGGAPPEGFPLAPKTTRNSPP